MKAQYTIVIEGETHKGGVIDLANITLAEIVEFAQLCEQSGIEYNLNYIK